MYLKNKKICTRTILWNLFIYCRCFSKNSPADIKRRWKIQQNTKKMQTKLRWGNYEYYNKKSKNLKYYFINIIKIFVYIINLI